MSSKSDCEEVNGVYVNGDRSDEHDALDGYHGDPEVQVDIGQSSKVQEAGPSSNGHEELIVTQAVEHVDSDYDDEEDADMGEFDDELVPWGLAHQLRSQRIS
ncbi:hypothetical protein Droror1_Dr00007510 [Drosera rotundifolia]